MRNTRVGSASPPTALLPDRTRNPSHQEHQLSSAEAKDDPGNDVMGVSGGEERPLKKRELLRNGNSEAWISFRPGYEDGDEGGLFYTGVKTTKGHVEDLGPGAVYQLR